jgi:hypothetical protein
VNAVAAATLRKQLIPEKTITALLGAVGERSYNGIIPETPRPLPERGKISG